jgi:hypothetical protein
MHQRALSARRIAVVASAGALVVLLTGTSGTLSGWTAGSVSNQANNALSSTLAFTHSYASTSCSITARGSGAVSCAGSISPTTAVTAGGVSTADAITNDGTLPAAQLVSDFRAVSCGTVQLANTKTAADPMLPRFATAFQQADPWSGTGSIALSSGAYASDAVATNTGTLLGGSYALGLWFKVANGYAAGGPLMSLSASPIDGTSAASSPMMWMDTAGKIHFRVSGTLGTSTTGVSAAAYNDGSWHLAVLSVTSAIVSTPTLYVDSAAGVSGSGLTALTGGNAYWHLGWADFTGVGSPPATTLVGSLAGAFATGAAVSSATRTSLFGSASASAYSTAVLALASVQQLWMLGDTGTTTYSGTLPVIGATAPCSMVDIGWSMTTPTGTVAAAGTQLSAFAVGTFHTVSAPAPAGSQTSTVTMSRDATWNSYISGLRLWVPMDHRIQSSGGAWLRTFSWSSSASTVIG